MPRTMNEAFGPYAQLHTEPSEPTWTGYAIAVAVALVIGAISWGCQQ